MSKIESQNEQAADNLKNFFVPSFAAGILLFLLGTFLLLAYNTGQIINWVGSGYLESANQLNLSINVLNNGFTNSFNTALDGRLGQIIFWSLLGALLYIVLWFLRNFINSFENDVIVDHYLHPQNFNRSGYWGSAIAGKIFFTAIVVVLIAYTFLALKVIMPAVGALTSTSIYNFRLPASVFYIVLCVLIPTVVIYLWSLIVRVLSHLWKLL